MSVLQVVQFINAMLIVLMVWKGFWRKSYTTILYNIAVFVGLYFFSVGEYEYCYLTITVVNTIAVLRASLHRQNDKLIKGNT